jgi:hypothetical protein
MQLNLQSTRQWTRRPLGQLSLIKRHRFRSESWDNLLAAQERWNENNVSGSSESVHDITRGREHHRDNSGRAWDSGRIYGARIRYDTITPVIVLKPLQSRKPVAHHTSRARPYLTGIGKRGCRQLQNFVRPSPGEVSFEADQGWHGVPFACKTFGRRPLWSLS